LSAVQTFETPSIESPRRRLSSDVERAFLALDTIYFWDAVKERNVEEMSKSLGNGVSPNVVRNGLDMTALHHLLLFAGMAPCARLSDYQLIYFLLQRGGDANARDVRGITPLHCAAAVNRPDLVALLLANGAEVDAYSDDGHSPLHYAANERSTSAARKLLVAGASRELKDNDGYTPCDYAMFAGADDELVQLLSI